MKLLPCKERIAKYEIHVNAPVASNIIPLHSSETSRDSLAAIGISPISSQFLSLHYPPLDINILVENNTRFERLEPASPSSASKVKGRVLMQVGCAADVEGRGFPGAEIMRVTSPTSPPPAPPPTACNESTSEGVLFSHQLVQADPIPAYIDRHAVVSPGCTERPGSWYLDWACKVADWQFAELITRRRVYFRVFAFRPVVIWFSLLKKGS